MTLMKDFIINSRYMQRRQKRDQQEKQEENQLGSICNMPSIQIVVDFSASRDVSQEYCLQNKCVEAHQHEGQTIDEKKLFKTKKILKEAKQENKGKKKNLYPRDTKNNFNPENMEEEKIDQSEQVQLRKCETFRVFISEYDSESQKQQEDEDIVERIQSTHLFKGEELFKLKLKNGEMTFISKANMKKYFPQTLLNHYESMIIHL